jgi:hypothetical protein
LNYRNSDCTPAQCLWAVIDRALLGQMSPERNPFSYLLLLVRGFHRARRIRRRLPAWFCFCSAAHPEIWVLIFARDYDLRVNLWQRLGDPPPLWCTCYNRSDAIHYDPNAHIGTVGNKTTLCSCRSDLGAGSPRRRLNGRRSGGCRLSRRRGRGLNGLGQCRASTELIKP